MLIAALVIGVVALAISVAGMWVVNTKITRTANLLMISRRVVVNLKSGTAIAGVVVSDDEERLVIKGAEVIEPGASAPTPADGEIVVDRVHIDYIQAP